MAKQFLRSQKKCLMTIDVIFCIGLLIAFIYGFRKGLISSLLSLISIFIAILAAVHFSDVAANYISTWFHFSSQNLPFISFIIVFIFVMLVFYLISKLIEGFLRTLHINFINKIAGATLWILAWIMLTSTLLFYSDNMNLLSDKTKSESVTYIRLHSFAPVSAQWIGKILPPVKNTFNSVNEWFKNYDEQNPEDKDSEI